MRLFENDAMDNVFVVEKLNKKLQSELKTLELRKAEIEQRLAQPTIKEVSLGHIYGVLCNFSKLMEITPPEQQKAILHRIIAEITLNPSDNIKGRSIKDIILVFDASENPDYVLTYGMVHRNGFYAKNSSWGQSPRRVFVA